MLYDVRLKSKYRINITHKYIHKNIIMGTQLNMPFRVSIHLCLYCKCYKGYKNIGVV